MTDKNEELNEWINDNIVGLADSYEEGVEPECSNPDSYVEDWKKGEFRTEDFKLYCQESFQDACDTFKSDQTARTNFYYS